MDEEEKIFAELAAAKQRQAEGGEQKEEVTTNEEQSTEEGVAVEQSQTEEAEKVETLAQEEIKEAEEVKEQVEPFNFLSYYKENKENIELATRDLESVDVNDVDTVATLLIDGLKGQGYSENEAITLLEEKYPIQFSDEDVDEDDEDTVKLLNREFIKMKSEGKKYLSELKEKQSQIKLEVPAGGNVPTSKDSVIEEYVSQQKQAFEAQQKEIVNARTQLANEVVSELKTLSFDLGGGNVVEYEPSAEDKEMLQKAVSDLPNYFSNNYVKEDGSADKEGLIQDLIAGRRVKELMKIALGHGNGQGRGKVIKQDFKNNTMSPNKSSSRERDVTGGNKIDKLTQAYKDGKIDLSQAW